MTLTVEKIVHGGDGLIRDGENVIFVPLVIPGEKIEVRIESGKGKTFFGRALRVVEPSPDRVEPPCPIFGRCGGCRFQHMTYSAELAAKRGIVEECLARIGGFTIPVPPVAASPLEYGYRSRVRFRIRGGRAGFFEEGSQEFVPLAKCLLARDEINRALPSLVSLANREKWGEVEMMLDDEGSLTALTQTKKGRRVFIREGKEWTAAPRRLTAFSQVNPEQNLLLKNLIGEIAAAARPECALELYAGAGNLTSSILPHAGSVTASDLDEDAVEMAREIFSSPALRFHAFSAEAMLEKTRRDKFHPDFILLDPPRAGAREIMSGLADLSPKKIVYVSCDPATLARDLKQLRAQNYDLAEIHVIDMFPRTAHVESIAIAEKN